MTQLKSNIRHLDLFSGIGGFAHAARTVWRDRYENVGFCEIDPFCQAVLRKNFPGCTIFGDIRAFANTFCAGLERSKHGESEGYDGQRHRERSDQTSFGTVDLITGGFPCQPFSVAGRRRGTDDGRYLWPPMFAVIRRFKPSWVIAENVSGLVSWSEGLVLEQVCADLESEGYEIQPFVIPSVAVNAPHRRDRIWIVAYDSSEGLQGELYRPRKGESSIQETAFAGSGANSSDVADTISRRGTARQAQRSQEGLRSGQQRFDTSDWNRDWREVAFATCHDRVDDGLSRRVVRLPDGSAISHARWRKEALKAYGNAIVPHVAIQIMEAIKEA